MYLIKSSQPFTYRRGFLHGSGVRLDGLDRSAPSETAERRGGVAHAQEGVHAAGETQALVCGVAEVDRGGPDDARLRSGMKEGLVV
jgi:hypothetical protein